LIAQKLQSLLLVHKQKVKFFSFFCFLNYLIGRKY